MVEAKLFLPLDVNSNLTAVEILKKVGKLYDFVKVGLEYMHAVGTPAAVGLPKSYGLEVFADTKLHDIPNQVRGAARSVAAQGVSYFTVMAGGMGAMISAALEGADEKARELGIARPKVVAVTVLTSLAYDDLLRKGVMPEDIGRARTPEEKQSFIAETVMRLAKEAVSAGADCLLSSPLEGAEMIRRWPDKEVITPGIRLPDSAPDDQKRTMPPYEARKSGIKGFVIGRLITKPPEGKTMADMARLVRSEIARAEDEIRRR